MFENANKRNLAVPAAIFATLLMVCCVFAAVSTPSDAVGDGTEGNPYVIDIAPGYDWSYTATFDSTLTGVKLTIGTNDLGADNVTADPDTHVVHVTVPEGTEEGLYDLQLIATHEASGQTAYQYIQFNVQNGLVITPSGENLNSAVVGEPKEYSFTVSTTFGSIETVDASIAGLTEDTEYTVDVTDVSEKEKTIKVTVTATEAMVGVKQTITVTAEAVEGESISADNYFDVYRDLVLTPTNTTIGNQSNASTVINIPEGITIASWTGVDALPEGVSWDAGTRTLSVSSDAFIDQDIVIGATSQDGQTAANVTISVENESATLNLTPSESAVITYNDNSEDPEVTFTLNETSNSGIKANSYSLATAIDGVDIDESTGTVTIDSSVVATTNVGATVTVNAETVFGKTVTGTFTLTVEGDLAFSYENPALILICDDDHSVSSEAFNGAAANATVTYSVEITGETQTGFQYDIEGDKLNVNSGTPAQTYQITVTAHTAGGQSESVTFTVNTFAVLSFTSVPQNNVGGQGI